MQVVNDSWWGELLNPQESVVRILQGFVADLREGTADEDQYRRVRKLVLHASPDRTQIPRKLVEARTLSEFPLDPIDPDLLEGVRHLAEQICRHDHGPWFEHLSFVRLLGEGGYGVVVLFEDELLATPLAVKFFRPSTLGDDPAGVSRFFREAGILANLRHPYIIGYRHAGLLKGVPFIAMDYFNAPSLQEWIRKKGPQNEATVTGILSRLAGALSYAHSQDVVHRDLTPSNVLVGERHELRLIDFGLSAYANTGLSRLTPTLGALDFGAYSAPELQSDSLALTPSIDVYSVGAIGFFCLTGRPPKGNWSSTFSDLGLGRLDPILRNCLENDPSKRFQSAGELEAALKPVSAMPVRTREHKKGITRAGANLLPGNGFSEITSTSRELESRLRNEVFHSLSQEWMAALAARAALRALPALSRGESPFRAFGPRTYLAGTLVGAVIESYGWVLDSPSPKLEMAYFLRRSAYGAAGKLAGNQPPVGAIHAATAVARAVETGVLAKQGHYGTSVDGREALLQASLALPASTALIVEELDAAYLGRGPAVNEFLLSELWPDPDQEWVREMQVFLEALRSSEAPRGLNAPQIADALGTLIQGELSVLELGGALMRWRESQHVRESLLHFRKALGVD